MMHDLSLFSWLGFVPVVYVLWLFLTAHRDLLRRAKADKGFGMRRASLGPAERKRWNREFFSWHILRVPLFLTIAEGLVLSFLLRIPMSVFAFWAFIAVCQLLPLAIVYCIHIWLLFRFGRFNLERFDTEQIVAKQVALLLFTLCVWIPLPAVWCYMHWIDLAR